MTPVDLLVVDGVETVTMIVVVAVDTAMNLMVVDVMVEEMTVTEDTAVVIVMTTMTLPAESIVMPDLVMVVIVTAVEVMSVVVEDTRTVTDTTEVVVMIDQLETRLLLLPMVIKLLVEMLESHMEVEPTMMTDIPDVNINC